MGSAVRILITTPADPATAMRVSQQAPEGSVIVLVPQRAELAAARGRYAKLENLMASPGDRAEIPWGDASFAVIVDDQPEDPTPEMLRVLAPNGRMLALEDVANGAQEILGTDGL